MRTNMAGHRPAPLAALAILAMGAALGATAREPSLAEAVKMESFGDSSGKFAEV